MGHSWPFHCEHDFRGAVACQLDQISQRLAAIDTKLEKIIMSQSDIDAAVQAETALVGDIATQVANVGTAQQAFATEIANLNSEIANLQGQGVNTTALNAITSQLTAAQGTLDSAVSALSAASQPPAPPAA